MQTKNLLLFFFLGFFAVFLSANSTAQEVDLWASDDASVFEAQPDKTVNEVQHASNVFVGEATDSTVIAYVKFDISNFQGRVLENASFSVRGAMEKGETMTVKLAESDNGFTRDTTTWSNRPSTSGELATVELNENSARKEFTQTGTALVDYINSKMANGADEVSFAIEYKSGAGDKLKWMGGKGDGSYGPQLSLAFSNEYAAYAIDDATAFSAMPDKTVNSVASSNIYVGEGTDSTVIAYIKFDISNYAGQVVSQADVSVRASMETGETMMVKLAETNNAFTRDTTTWNNKPSSTGELATLELTENSARKVFQPVGSNLTDYINAQLAKGADELAFAVEYKSGAGDKLKWMGGYQDGSYGPMLEMEFGVGVSSSELIPTDDASVFSAKPDKTVNFKNSSNIYVGEGTDSTVIAYLKFNIEAFAGKVVDDASLSVRAAMNSGETMTVKLTESGNAFTRDTTTWNNKPSTSGELATLQLNENSARKTFEPVGSNLSDYINGKLASGEEELSFAIEYKSGAGDQLKWMGGVGDGSYGPRLQLNFARKYSGWGIDDATAFSAMPDATANDKSNSNIYVGKATDSTVISFVKFKVDGIQGQVVEKADFSVRAAMSKDTSEMTVKLTKAGTEFTRDTTTWNNKPSTSGELGTVTLTKNSARKTFEPTNSALTDYINTQLVKGAKQIAFGIEYKSGDGADLTWMGGVGDGSYGPKLELGFEQPLQNDTLLVIDDVWADETNTDKNNNGTADMQVMTGEDALDTTKQVFLKFDISQLEDAAMGRARLFLYAEQKPTAVEEWSLSVNAVEDVAWQETSLTWNNKPAVGEELMSVIIPHPDNQATKDTIVTSEAFTHYVNEAVLAGKDSLAIALTGKNVTDNRIWVAEKEWTSEKAAKLIADYTVEPPEQDLGVVADAYVSQVDGEQGTNFGDQADMNLINDDSNNKSKWVYLKYDISNAYKEAVSAGLNLYASIHSSASGLENLPFAVYGVDNTDWGEYSITWENKPGAATDALVNGTATTSGKFYNLVSPDLTDYINEAIDDGKDSVAFVVKATKETPGNRGWISGREYKPSSIAMNYEPQVAQPKFDPAPGNYIDTVEVSLSTSTSNAQIYYTLDGTTPDSTNGTLYSEPLKLADTTTIQAIAYAGDLKASPVATGVYYVKPVGTPQFSPSPEITYTSDYGLEVTITVEPEEASIVYSTEEGEPINNAYTGPIPIDETTTIRALAFDEEENFSDTAKATYTVLQAVEGVGKGPGGVGYSGDPITGQPDNVLWLQADEGVNLQADSAVNAWMDQSGYGHNATDSAGFKPEHYHKELKPAPTLVQDAFNGKPGINFGSSLDDMRAMMIKDADKLDGGTGVSIFFVFKRNAIRSEFSVLMEKRDLGAGVGSWNVEFSGGGDPNSPQLIINRDHYALNTERVFDQPDVPYILNGDYSSKYQISSMRTNGNLDITSSYSQPVNSTDAPVVIGNADPSTFGEIIVYREGLNMPQTVIVHNYLAAKYGLTLEDHAYYSNTDYTADLIGIGKDKYIDDKTEQSHRGSSGGGLELTANSAMAVGDYVFAAHNGAEVTNADSWEREWYVDTVGNAVDVKMAFDFEAVGLSAPTAATDYILKLDGNQLDVTPTLEEGKIVFELSEIDEGVYSFGKAGAQPQVATPTFDPEGGEYNEAQEVTISTTTEGADIYYTTDGTDPDSTSTEYTDAVTVDEDMTLKAIAYKEGMTTSEIASADYTIVTGLNDPMAGNFISIYPNPVRNEAVIAMDNEELQGRFNLKVYNYVGNVVIDKQLNKHSSSYNYRLDMSELPAGIYLIEVSNDDIRSVRRIMKQ